MSLAPTVPLRPPPPPARTWLVPLASTLAGSLVGALATAADTPVLPSFGLLMALGWRLLRPELWPAWMALPLGLADDLIGGAPLGSAPALWTATFLALDMADHQPMWRDVAADWQLATAAIVFNLVGAWALALFAGGAGPLWTILPQTLIGILCFPAAMRVTATLDRWRLWRGLVAAADD